MMCSAEAGMWVCSEARSWGQISTPGRWANVAVGTWRRSRIPFLPTRLTNVTQSVWIDNHDPLATLLDWEDAGSDKGVLAMSIRGGTSLRVLNTSAAKDLLGKLVPVLGLADRLGLTSVRVGVEHTLSRPLQFAELPALAKDADTLIDELRQAEKARSEWKAGQASRTRLSRLVDDARTEAELYRGLAQEGV